MRFTQEISIFNPHAIEFAVLETRTQITQTAEAIRLEAAQTLARYSTTVQMNAAIEVSASGVLTTVSRTLQDYSTTEQMNTAIQTSASGIRVDINNTLRSYSTTSQMNTAIQASASGVLSTVSSTYATKTTTNSLQSQINQSAHTIALSVSGTAGKSAAAGITVTLKDKNGNIISSGSGNVYIDGNVIFSSQLTDGTTTISGSNIKTGTINASLVNVTNINASNITTGTLTGREISGGKLIQTVSGAGTGGWGGDANGTQAKIENGIVTAGQLSITTNSSGTERIDIVPEGDDDAGGYNGILVKGHLSTYGCIWAGQEATDAFRINCRGNMWVRDIYVAALGGWLSAYVPH